MVKVDEKADGSYDSRLVEASEKRRKASEAASEDVKGKRAKGAAPKAKQVKEGNGLRGGLMSALEAARTEAAKMRSIARPLAATAPSLNGFRGKPSLARMAADAAAAVGTASGRQRPGMWDKCLSGKEEEMSARPWAVCMQLDAGWLVKHAKSLWAVSRKPFFLLVPLQTNGSRP